MQVGMRVINKPDRATMRPDYVSACIDHVTYMERQMDRQTDETARVVTEALKTRLSLIRFSIGSQRGKNQPKNAVFAQA